MRRGHVSALRPRAGTRDARPLISTNVEFNFPLRSIIYLVLDLLALYSDRGQSCNCKGSI